LRKKILHIIIKSSYDGAAVYPVRLCDKMEEYDHMIISCFKGNAYEEILTKGIKCENLVNSGNISYKYLLLKYLRFISYIIKRSFDIIHYHQGGIGILLLAFLFRKKAKVIHHLHSGNLIGNNTKQNISFLHLTILKYLAGRTIQICVAKHVFDEYLIKIKQSQNLRLIKNSTPFVFRKKERMMNSIGFIGRFSEEKGFSVLIDISAKLIAQYPGLKIFLMGEEPEYYSKVLADVNPGIVLITPSFNVEKFYTSIDLLLFLSSAPEGIPLVVLEALSFDVGIIAFPLQGVKEILGNDYPLYVNSNEAVLEKLILYYSGKINLDELSQTHERINKEYNYEEMLTAIRQFYSQCLTT
jgi:glycosyltransferase involved in cell wall biosynthesis